MGSASAAGQGNAYECGLDKQSLLQYMGQSESCIPVDGQGDHAGSQRVVQPSPFSPHDPTRARALHDRLDCKCGRNYRSAARANANMSPGGAKACPMPMLDAWQSV